MRSGRTGPMRRTGRVLAAPALALLVACGGATGEEKGGGMFGLFKRGKAAAPASLVAPEVGAPLVRQAVFPPDAVAAPAAFGDCGEAALRGRPPTATLVPTFVPGETLLGFRIGAQGGMPPLMFFNMPGRQAHIELWELGAGAQPALARQRPVQLGEGQARWVIHSLVAAGCLPGGRTALAVHYADPTPKDALFVYDAAAQRFQALGAVEPESSRLPLRYFELMGAGRDAALLRWGSDGVRLAAERYARGREHLVLFGPRHPDGLQVLDLALTDGNVRRWGLVGRTLWLETEDPRVGGGNGGGGSFVWSLDLSRVL